MAVDALGAARVETFGASGHHGAYAAFGSSPSMLLNARVDTVRPPVLDGSRAAVDEYVEHSRSWQLIEAHDAFVHLLLSTLRESGLDGGRPAR